MGRCTPLISVLVLACSQPVPASDRAAEAAHASSGEKLDLSGWRVAGEETGLLLAWQPEGGEVPRNRDFEVAVVLFQDGQPLPGAKLSVRGWMPDHQHGLVKSPQVREDGDGTYHVQGLLLHMRGSWELIFDVEQGTNRSSFPFSLEL